MNKILKSKWSQKHVIPKMNEHHYIYMAQNLKRFGGPNVTIRGFKLKCLDLRVF